MIHSATMRAIRNALRLGSLIALAVALPGQAPPIGYVNITDEAVDKKALDAL